MSADLERYFNVISGHRCASATGRWLTSSDPFTGAPLAVAPHCSPGDVNQAVEEAHSAFTSGPWASMKATARGKLLRRLDDLIARDAEKLASVEVRDNGTLYPEMTVASRN